MTKIDHVFTPGKIVCPHCGHESDDDWYTSENAYSGVEDCEQCGRRYQYECVDTTHYWTTSTPA